MGTLLRIKVEAPDRAAAIGAIEDAFQAVRRVDSLLSTWRSDSEIARLNQAPSGLPVSVSPELFAALDEAHRWQQETGGAFDPAIGALIDAWDLRGRGRRPSPVALARARSASGMQHLSLSETDRTARRTHQGVWLDTGGFGKGVALREAGLALRSSGITSAFINFGGQVMAVGSDAGRKWTIPVAHPSHRGRPALWIRIPSGSASTSAQSERFVTLGKERVGHILDPRTGQPVPAWGSVTVVTDDPAAADALSTALLVLGPEDGLRWAHGRSDIAALFLIEHEGRLIRRWTAGLEEFLVSDCPPNGEQKCADR